MENGIKVIILFFTLLVVSNSSQALTLHAFSNVHVPSLIPEGLAAALTSTSAVTNGVGRLLVIDADHLEVICSTGSIDDSDGVLRVDFNVNSIAAADGLHINASVFVQYRVFAEHIFRACGNGSRIIVTAEKTSFAQGGAC